MGKPQSWLARLIQLEATESGRPYLNTREEEQSRRTPGDNLRPPHHAYTPTHTPVHTHVTHSRVNTHAHLSTPHTYTCNKYL